MTHHANHPRGFTLVELMLALAFVGFVLIFAITTVIQVMRTYNKGLAIKEINQVARAVTDDMGRVIRQAEKSAAITAPLTDPGGNKARVCFDGTSYVWNFTNSSLNTYTDDSRVTLARVEDPGGALCVPSAGVYPKVDRNKATELLSNRVWIHRLAFDSLANTWFYTIQVQLSTADDIAQPALLYDPSNPDPIKRVVCKGDNDGQFCAVANFSTTVNARGGY